MKTKNLMMVFTMLCLVLFASSPTWAAPLTAEQMYLDPSQVPPDYYDYDYYTAGHTANFANVAALQVLPPLTADGSAYYFTPTVDYTGDITDTNGSITFIRPGPYFVLATYTDETTKLFDYGIEFLMQDANDKKTYNWEKIETPAPNFVIVDPSPFEIDNPNPPPPTLTVTLIDSQPDFPAGTIEVNDLKTWEEVMSFMYWQTNVHVELSGHGKKGGFFWDGNEVPIEDFLKLKGCVSYLTFMSCLTGAGQEGSDFIIDIAMVLGNAGAYTDCVAGNGRDWVINGGGYMKRAELGQATNPKPPDIKIDISRPLILSWTPGPWVQDAGLGGRHAVYFGTEEANVTDATPGNPMDVYKGRQDPCSYDPGLLTMDTAYYWRIDEYNDANEDSPWKGNIWQFRTQGPTAGSPVPADKTFGLSISLQLRWSAGALTQPTNGHAVYFGPNETDVTDASIGNPLGCFKGYVSDPVYKLSNLNYDLVADTTYYWRIDESNGIDIWKGEVWQVKNTNYFVIEDFGLYTDNASMRAKWKMGSVDYTSCPYQNSNGVIDFDFNDGQGRMQFDYDNSFGNHFSEVRFDANNGNASGTDWTGGSALPDNDKARALAISYIGGPYNDADGDYDRMYAAIEDTAGNFGAILHSDSQAQRSCGWTQWFIDLNDFNDTATPLHINLANIKYLYLGFGGRCLGNYYGGGTGRVRFDDIRLYQKTCQPQYGPVGDLTSDCKVDLADLDVMANAWLARQTIISPVTNPGTTGLRLWYKFDATTGITVADSSGHGYDGEVNSAPLFADIGQPTTILWDPTGGYDGSGCFVSSLLAIRDFNMSIEADANALDANGTSITLSIWVNGDTYMPLSGCARLICAFQDINPEVSDESEVIEIQCPVPRSGATANVARFKAGVTGASDEVSSAGMPMSAFAGSWQHYAFVRDGVANKLRIYHNGEMIADADALNPLFTPNVPFESFRLIRRNQGSESWYGKMDDFRVYNRALSQAEIGWLGTKGTGVVPFVNASNLKSSTPEKISFNDMAMLAKNWLTYQTWPNP